jgi:hypothetical protein
LRPPALAPHLKRDPLGATLGSMPKHSNRKSRFVAVLERDLDLLLLEEICVSSEFREWFASRAGLRAPGPFADAFHSMRDGDNRETDLLVVFGGARQPRAALLVENKIAAAFQPDQARDYQARAQRLKRQEGYRVARTVLTAPRSYITEHTDSTHFDARIPYEDIHGWFMARPQDPRATFRANLLEWCLARAATGPVDKDVQTVWEACWAELQRLHTGLRIRGWQPGKRRTAKATWIYFHFRERPRGAFLRYRIRDNWVELAFQRRLASRVRLQHWLGEHPLPGARVYARGRTEHAVWLPTPDLPLGAARTSLSEPLKVALQKTDDLRQWWLRVREPFARGA